MGSAGKATLSARFTGITLLGGLPATLVAVTTDLGAAQGAWILSVVLGVAAILGALYILLMLWLRPEKTQRSRWYRLTASNDELNWIWDTRRYLRSHGVHVLLIFGAACLLAGMRSRADASTGGILGTNIAAVQKLQDALGLSQIARDVRTIAEAEARRSKDCRKELASLGAGSFGAFEEAITYGDARLIKDFAACGYKLDRGLLVAVFLGGREDAQKLLSQYPEMRNDSECVKLIKLFIPRRVSEARPAARNLFKVHCDSPAIRSLLLENIATSTRESAEQKRKYEEDKVAAPTKAACVEELTVGNRRVLRNEVATRGVALLTAESRTARENMLVEVLMANSSDAVDKAVNKYCALASVPPRPSENPYLIMWNEVLSIVS